MKRTLVLVLGLFNLYAACGDEPAGAVVSASGIVVNLRDGGDRITFALYKNLPEFVIEIPQPEQADPLVAALQNASTTLRGVVVRYSLDSADLSAGEALPTFRVVGLTYEGREVPVPAAGRSATKPLSGPEQAWARGVGLYVAGKHGEAISEFDRALSDSSLTSGQRLQGYQLRGLAIVDGVQSETRTATDAGDRKLIRAVDDLRKWQALAPDDAEPLYQLGFALRGLGAYPEALQIYEEVSHSWPTEYFWSAIRIGDTYRESGDRRRALAALDDLLKEHGAQRGMAFHYHRGWALIDVGRYSEAIEELTRGLDDQPNYPWAFAWRACAENQASRFDDAVRDQQTAVTLVNELADDSLPSRFNQKRAVEIEANLEAAAAEHRVAPFSTVCNGYWEGDGSRQRSSQLPLHLAWVPIHRDPIRAFLASHRMTIVAGVMAVLLLFGFEKWRAYLVRSR